MSKPDYKTVTRTQGNNRALKEGTVEPETFNFVFTEFPVLVDGFRRMVRGNEFDICEMAITTYICAKSFGKPFTALPIFLVRLFHHGGILYNTKSGIKSPKDLEGKRVGVSRGYTVTGGVWSRSVLQEEYGVDLAKITWVLSGDEHVQEYQPPPNVVSMEPGKQMAEMLISGELVAAIGLEGVNHPDIAPLIPNPLDAGIEAMRSRGHYPINHLVVVRDELLAAHPDLARDVFNTFARSKNLYLEKLRAGQLEKLDDADRTALRVMDLTGGADPLPYGVAPNRQIVETLVKHAVSQGIIKAPIPLETLFEPTTFNLIG